MTWIMTGTGRKIDFLNPDPDQIWMIDIQRALSRNPRFGGHGAIVVAQHLIEIVHIMLRRAEEQFIGLTEVEKAEIALVAMIHDFPEYVLVDVPTPLKRVLGPVYAEIEDRLLKCMLKKWRLTAAYERWEELLKWADQDAVQQEAIRYKMDGFYLDSDLKPHTRPNEWVPQDRPINLHSYVWSEEEAAKMLGALWNRNLILSDREEGLDSYFFKKVIETANEFNVTIKEMARQPIGPEGIVFNDGHKGYLI